MASPSQQSVLPGVPAACKDSQALLSHHSRTYPGRQAVSVPGPQANAVAWPASHRSAESRVLGRPHGQGTASTAMTLNGACTTSPESDGQPLQYHSLPS